MGKKPDINSYFGVEAERYANSNWMTRNQRAMTTLLLEFLEDGSMGGEFAELKDTLYYLDIGCGTGNSLFRISEEGNGHARVVGLDFSFDMLTQLIIQNSQSQNYNIINADMRHIPLRNHIFDNILSVSAFNFASAGGKNEKEFNIGIKKSVSELSRVLTRGDGRCAIEFYPSEKEEKRFMLELKKNNFDGGLLIQDPETKKEKKILLVKR